MKYLRIILNWFTMLTSFMWLPLFIILLEISLIPKCFRLPREKRCPTYRALFIGDCWWFSFVEVFSEEHLGAILEEK